MIDPDTLDEISKRYQEAMEGIERAQEEMWENLTHDQRLAVFCCVSRRIYRGELVEKRSYRGMLYDVFGFGPESYAQAQHAEYLTIHNNIYDIGHDKDLLTAFAVKHGIENPEEAAKNFLYGDKVAFV